MAMSSRRQKAAKKKNPAGIRNTVIVVVIGLLVLIIGGQMAAKAAARRSRAQKILKEVRPVLEKAVIVEDIQKNNDTLVGLGAEREKLEKIPRDLDEYDQGLKLAAEIDATCSEIRKKNAQLQSFKDSADRLEQILSKLKDGSITPEKGKTLLDQLAAKVQGTETGTRAAAEAKKIKVELGEELAGDLNSEITKIRGLIKSGKYSSAADEIGRLMAMDLPDPDGLVKKVDQELVDAAAEAFDKITMDIIDRSKNEDKAKLRQELKAKYDEFGIRALKSRYDRTLERLK